MDKLSKLEALMGIQNSVQQEHDSVQLRSRVKACNIYEGSDSEDDEVITSRAVQTREARTQDKAEEDEGEEGPRVEVYIQKVVPDDLDAPTIVNASIDFSFDSRLELGEVAEEGKSFCSLMAIKKYPYSYIGVANQQKVAEGFFDQGKLMSNSWDLYYIHRSLSNFQNQPIILVPTKQFKTFLEAINTALNIKLTIPTPENGAFSVRFTEEGMPQPRYLGRSTSIQEADDLKMNVPPNSYRLKGERHSTQPEDRSLAAFQKKIELLSQAAKGKKKANKEKQKLDRIVKQQSWCNSIKRVQRYLGLRTTCHGDRTATKPSLENTTPNVTYSSTTNNAATTQLALTMFSPNFPSTFAMEGDVIFISIDVEAYERDNTKITEIGVSTLDTRDIAGLVPGIGGVEWFKAICSRHFRIKEYLHLKNTQFVDGCADRFEFGTSEFISIKDVSTVIAGCFAPPFSKASQVASNIEQLPKRRIILVGQDVKADINFLRSVSYDVYSLSNLVEEVDTASMWRYCTRDSNPRNLGSILAELHILGWNLHNAGNDATYTLQAMIAISIKHIVDKQKAKAVQAAEKAKRISENVAEATVNAIEREEGWSSGGSDGGDPVPPSVAGLSKGRKQLVTKREPTMSASHRTSINAEGPWKLPMRPTKWAFDGKLDTWGQDLAASAVPGGTSSWTNPIPSTVLPWSAPDGSNLIVASSTSVTNTTGGWGTMQLLTNPPLPNESPGESDEHGNSTRSTQWGESYDHS